MSNDTTMTPEQELAALKAENEKLRAKVERKQTISMKVSEKGGLSVYGLGRFPVTLYRQQWERLIGVVPESRPSSRPTPRASRSRKTDLGLGPNNSPQACPYLAPS